MIQAPRFPIVCVPSDPPQRFPDFEARLEVGGGRNDFGGPRLRLTWAGSATKIAFGMTCKAYRDYAVDDRVAWVVNVAPDGAPRDEREFPADVAAWTPEQLEFATYPGRFRHETREYGQEHYVLEQWIHPNIACRGWDAVNARMKAQLGVAPLGPRPDRGCYVAFKHLTAPDGGYREPTREDLDEALAAVAAEQVDPYLTKYSPDEPTPDWVLELAVDAEYRAIARGDEERLDADTERFAKGREDAAKARVISLPTFDRQKETA